MFWHVRWIHRAAAQHLNFAQSQQVAFTWYEQHYPKALVGYFGNANTRTVRSNRKQSQFKVFAHLGRHVAREGLAVEFGLVSHTEAIDMFAVACRVTGATLK
jgi:hypothetical protein